MSSDLRHQIQWSHFAAGIAGGAVSTLVLHPLDLVKIRLQVNEGTGEVSCRPRHEGVIRTLVDVFKIRGARGLYLGLTPNLIGASGSWGLYFLLYAALKSSLQHSDPTVVLRSLDYLGCGAIAGSITLTLMNPIWVVKTRLCLQYERLAQVSDLAIVSTNASRVTSTLPDGARIPHPQRPISVGTALAQLWRYEGVQGLYRGYLPGLLGVSHGAIQFMLYENLRNSYNQKYRHRTVDSKLTVLEYLAFASISKLVSACITYPYQVIRSRMQDQHRQYTGLLHVMRVLWNGEGLYGFYKGLLPNLLRVTPACAITFVVYENTMTLLKSYT